MRLGLWCCGVEVQVMWRSGAKDFYSLSDWITRWPHETKIRPMASFLGVYCFSFSHWISTSTEPCE
jgi:hypothetical protein